MAMLPGMQKETRSLIIDATNLVSDSYTKLARAIVENSVFDAWADRDAVLQALRVLSVAQSRLDHIVETF